MNNDKTSGIIFCVAAAMDYITAIIYFLGTNKYLGGLWLCIGSFMLCVGVRYFKRLKNTGLK